MKNSIDYKKIRRASVLLAQSTDVQKNLFLKSLGEKIVRNQKKILAANARDIKSAEAKGLERAFIQRLVLDEKGLRHLAVKVQSVQKLKSGLGETIEKTERDGLILKKVRVPLGVLAVIYEARPEVTTDVASLCVKSGNAAILKGGSEALATNTALYACIRAALKKSGLPEDAVTFITTGDRAVTNEMLTRHDGIDLVIARGGYAMVKGVMERTKIPVLAHSAGGARVYVDKSADLAIAERTLVNAKINKPSACDSLDTILVHRAIAKKFIPLITKAMEAEGVTVRRQMDWDEETLSLKVGIKVVKDADEAIAFIEKHSKKHTEGIVAKDAKVVKRFLNVIDAAALFVNASIQLHDGYVFGLGAEMGISTSKLHARGPVGLKELTTYKWEVYGHGNIRQ